MIDFREYMSRRGWATKQEIYSLGGKVVCVIREVPPFILLDSLRVEESVKYSGAAERAFRDVVACSDNVGAVLAVDIGGLHIAERFPNRLFRWLDTVSAPPKWIKCDGNMMALRGGQSPEIISLFHRTMIDNRIALQTGQS